MAKGFVTQGMCLLTDGQPTIEMLRSALEKHDFKVVDQRPAHEDWRFGGPALTLAYRPEVNGYVAIDVVNHPWPDTMGDPKSDPLTFGAWSLGHFGPLVYPGNLARAAQHAWGWEPGRTMPAQHKGFVRLRLSYVFGAKAPDPLRPEDSDPIGEMDFLSRVVLALTELILDSES